MRKGLSAVLITCNESHRIAECLDRLSFVEDVVVADSGSSDNTVAIAESFGARVVHASWMGFGPHKQFAVKQAANDWVLCVDADEWVSDELRESILATLEDPQYRVYKMARRNRFMGRWLSHGEGYPDYNIRLFDRTVARWSDDEVHEHVVTEELVGTLDGDLLHNTHETLATYLRKQRRYTTIQAQALQHKSTFVLCLKMIASPVVRFIKFYLLRLGFLDGLPGLTHILIGCSNSSVKCWKALRLKWAKK